jgi:hypothetical protein
MLSRDELARLPGATAHDRSGNRVGEVGQVLYDEHTGAPTWVTIRTGRFEAEESFAPLRGARLDGRSLLLAHDTDAIVRAPRRPEDGYLSPSQEEELLRHYDPEDVAPC